MGISNEKSPKWALLQHLKALQKCRNNKLLALWTLKNFLNFFMNLIISKAQCSET